MPALAGLLAPGPAEAAQADARPLQIYMVQWRGPTETDAGFMDYFHQEGIAAEFIVRNAERNPAAVPAFVAEIKATRPDLVYIWGGAAPPLVVGRYDAIDPERHVTEVPVVTCMVADPVELGVVPSWESSGRNVTGTSHVAPLEVQVNAMHAYARLQRLAVLYNPTEPGPVVVVEKLRALAKLQGFELAEWTVPVSAEGKPQPEGIPDVLAAIARTKPDFLYLGPDSYLGAHAMLATRLALEQGLRVFGSSEVYLKGGMALGGVVSRYYNMGQFCAYKAELILLRGVAPKDIPFETLQRFSYMINIDTAKQADFFPPIQLLNMAEILQHGG
jgi:putative tryptophan/tyrosine transport system substrate-binding protein